jgi:hypothetical protein
MDKKSREQISRNDILEAIASLNRGETHDFGPSTNYDLLEAGRKYAPKAVVGLAARRALGRPLRPDEFSGGQEAWAFRLLRDRGFTVVRKEEIADQHELPEAPPARIWIEYTKTSAHGHGGVGWDFGSCLWSPSTYQDGKDGYALMRDPKLDDLVIHINDGDLVGWSRVAAPFREVAEEPPLAGPWAGRSPYYRIDLKDYEEFSNVIPLTEFIEENDAAIEDEIKNDQRENYPFILYSGNVRPAQGAYLTRCTPKLYELMRTELFDPNRIASLPKDKQRSSDRRDPTVAKARFESIFPNEHHQTTCMALFADAIMQSHTYGAARWEVTLTRRKLRLNVGSLRALEFAEKFISFGVIRDEIDPALQQIIAKRGTLRAKDFNTQPTTTVCRLPVEVVIDHYNIIWALLKEFIAIAATTAVQSPYHQAHSSGVLVFLRAALNRELPDPEYRERKKLPAEKTAQSGQVIAFRSPRTLFRKVDYELEGLLKFVETGFMALPDIQRPFVWTRTKVRNLFDSMYRGFPIGHLVFWAYQEVGGFKGIGLEKKHTYQRIS